MHYKNEIFNTEELQATNRYAADADVFAAADLQVLQAQQVRPDLQVLQV